MTEQRPKSANNNDQPLPGYENDPTWTEERQERFEKLFADIYEEDLTVDEAIQQTTAMIEEIQVSVGNLETEEGMAILEKSPMLQKLLFAFYALHKEKAASGE